MRITTVSTINSWVWNNNYWSAHYTSGTVTNGSSGSALMNSNGQITGQLRSGWSCCNLTDFGDRYGKFNHSWNGAGFQTWLSPNQGLQSTGLLNLTTISINGPNTIACTSPTQYSTLLNLLDVTYTWSVSAGLQIISGQGTSSVTISGLSGNQYGSGTLTLTLNSPTKGRIRAYTVSKAITISTGSYIGGTYNSPTNLVEVLTPTPKKVLNFPGNSSCVAIATNMAIPSGSTVTWGGSAGPGVTWYQVGNDVFCNFTALNQIADLNISISDACGTYSENYLFRCTSMSPCGIQPLRAFNPQLNQITLSPNPANNILRVTLNQQKTNKEADIQRSIKEIRIANKIGNLKLTQKYSEVTKEVNVDISRLKTDVYTILIYDGKTWIAEKFIKN